MGGGDLFLTSWSSWMFGGGLPSMLLYVTGRKGFSGCLPFPFFLLAPTAFAEWLFAVLWMVVGLVAMAWAWLVGVVGCVFERVEVAGTAAGGLGFEATWAQVRFCVGLLLLLLLLLVFLCADLANMMKE